MRHCCKEQQAVFRKLKNHKNFSKNRVVECNFFTISLLKPSHFSKSHIYSKRGNFGASPYAKNSILIYFRKIDFSKGGAPLNLV